MLHLAIDIGASSGRHIAARFEDGKITHLQEVYRFENLPQSRDGHLVWDLEMLCREVVNGLAAAKEAGLEPDTVGIDTWGVDYVLLDENDAPILPVYCYRDARGAKAAEKVHEIIPFAELYGHTGIQYQPFNTVYQMMDDKLTGRLECAADFLMLPEYLSFYLCGVKQHEYTETSTTSLLNAQEKKWDLQVIRKLGFPERLFRNNPVRPPVLLGTLRDEIAQKTGLRCRVVLPATHDTASAIEALPQKYSGGTARQLPEKTAYISSGTWSLLGTELAAPLTNQAAMEANYANEGGVGTIRFLKNIMGLWMVQCLRREHHKEYSFAQLAQMAQQEAKFDYRLDVNAQRYLAPESICSAIDEECREKGFPVPQTAGEYAHAIYQSLAHAYAQALDGLEKLTGEKYGALCIVGGGGKNEYLNRLTEKAIGRPVIVGESEATAIGNLLMQMRAVQAEEK